jgi:hypothetical protein
MTVLHPAPVESNRFLWDKDSKMFLAEASDLGRQPFGRVYDDACDEGLTLVSSRFPGREVVFVVNHVERDRERELLWWDLVPADFKNVGFTVRVYND